MINVEKSRHYEKHSKYEHNKKDDKCRRNYYTFMVTFIMLYYNFHHSASIPELFPKMI